MNIETELRRAGTSIREAVERIELPPLDVFGIRPRKGPGRRRLAVVAVAFLLVLSVAVVASAESGPMIAVDGGESKTRPFASSKRGEEIRLIPKSFADVSPFTSSLLEKSEVHFVAQIEGTEIVVALFTMPANSMQEIDVKTRREERNTRPDTCLGSVNDADGFGFACGYHDSSLPSVGFSDERGARSFVSWLNLPENTAFVTMKSGKLRYWQRPTDRAVAFPYPSDADKDFSMTAYENGGQAHWGFSRENGISIFGRCFPRVWLICRPS